MGHDTSFAYDALGRRTTPLATAGAAKLGEDIAERAARVAAPTPETFAEHLAEVDVLGPFGTCAPGASAAASASALTAAGAHRFE